MSGHAEQEPHGIDARDVRPGGRVQASCTCGQSWDVPARAWEWVSDSHARAHNKGRDGLSAAGAFTYGRQPEVEAEAG